MHARNIKMKKRCLLQFVNLLFASLLFSQRYSFKNFPAHNGLVQTDITDIKQG